MEAANEFNWTQKFIYQWKVNECMFCGHIFCSWIVRDRQKTKKTFFVKVKELNIQICVEKCVHKTYFRLRFVDGIYFSFEKKVKALGYFTPHFSQTFKWTIKCTNHVFERWFLSSMNFRLPNLFNLLFNTLNLGGSCFNSHSFYHFSFVWLVTQFTI